MNDGRLRRFTIAENGHAILSGALGAAIGHRMGNRTTTDAAAVQPRRAIMPSL